VHPAAIVLVRYGASGDEPVPLSVPEGLDLQVVDRVEQHRADALRAGVEVLREMSPSPGAVAILDESDAPARRHVERCGEVLGRQSAVGVASFWERVGGAVVSRPCPARPYQWLWNDAAAASVFRIDALGSLVDLPLTEDPMYDRWYLANTVLASGWAGVTVPEVLAERSTPVGWVSRLDSTRAVEAIHRPFRVTMAEDAPELVSIARSGFAGALRSPTFRPREFSELAVRLVSDWRRALTWGWKKVAGRVWRG
jgi:hypothetical protein